MHRWAVSGLCEECVRVSGCMYECVGVVYMQ